MRFEGRQDKKQKQDGHYQQEKVFHMKTEMLSKFADRKDSLLFMSSCLIPWTLWQPAKCFQRAGSATASHLILISTFFCIPEVSVEIQGKASVQKKTPGPVK